MNEDNVFYLDGIEFPRDMWRVDADKNVSFVMDDFVYSIVRVDNQRVLDGDRVVIASLWEVWMNGERLQGFRSLAGAKIHILDDAFMRFRDASDEIIVTRAIFFAYLGESS